MAVHIGAGNPSSTVNPLGDAQGIAMGKGKPKGGRKLAVRVTYEGSRLSSDCLTQAYERIVPLARAQTKTTEDLTESAARVQPARRR